MDQNAVLAVDSRDTLQLSWSTYTPYYRSPQSSDDNCSGLAHCTGRSYRNDGSRECLQHPTIFKNEKSIQNNKVGVTIGNSTKLPAGLLYYGYQCCDTPHTLAVNLCVKRSLLGSKQDQKRPFFYLRDYATGICWIEKLSHLQ